MFGLSLIDILVILLYFCVIISIGAWSSRRIKNQEDFFLAGRRFGKWIQVFAAFGQGTSSDTAVSVSTTTFTNGASGIWSSLLYLFGTPFYWLVAPWMRRLRLLTMGDYFRERYGSQRMAAIYAVIGSIGMMGFIAVGFTAMTKTIVALTPKSAQQFTAADTQRYRQTYRSWRQQHELRSANDNVLSYEELLERDNLRVRTTDNRSMVSLSTEQRNRLLTLETMRPATFISHIRDDVLVWIVCLVVMLYAVTGGLEAAFLTDTIQGLFIILLSVLLIPFAWAKINTIYGGSSMMDALHTIHAQLPAATFEMFGSPHAIDFTWYYIGAISIMAVLTVPIQPNMLVACGSAKNEYAARYGFTVGCFLKRLCTVFWGIFGLAAILIYTGKVPHSDLVWGYATRDLLGPLGLGMVGLMIACLMAALMSTVDCLMITCSSLLTHNLFAPLYPQRSQCYYVWAGRVFGAAVVIGGAWIALQFDTILQILKFIWEINVMLIPAFWLGMKWRRANCTGAWISIVFGALLFLVIPVLGPKAMPPWRTNEYLVKTTDPAPLTRSYIAREVDVLDREEEIQAWDDRQAAGGQTTGPRLKPLRIGDTFEAQYTLPRKSIFWTQGVWPDENGQLTGRGALNLELLLLDSLGWDLSANPYALNETIRIAIRIAASLGIMVVVSLLSRPDDREHLDRFYAKMRVKVLTDREADAREVAHSREDPHRHDDRLLLPGSNWEFLKWDREDVVGFLAAVAAVCGVLLLMTYMVNLGS